MDVRKAALSDYFAKLPASPETFPFFYRRLVRLCFPIDVAEILELRYLSHNIIDNSTHTGTDPNFASARTAEMASLGIFKPTHQKRLLQLLVLINQFHTLHIRQSEEAERTLRAALTDNHFASKHSHRYSRTTGTAALITALSAIFLSPPALFMETCTGLFTYLSIDYMYSLSALKRENTLIRTHLNHILRHRVRTLNWKAVVRQIGAILGYTIPHGGEAFRLEHSYEYESSEYESSDLIESPR